MGQLAELFEDEPNWLDRAQILGRTGMMLVRGMVSFASCSVPPKPTLRGRRVQIRNRQHITLGSWCVIEDDVVLQGRTTNGINIGDRVSIGRGAQIRPTGFYGRKPGKGLTVGDRANIGIGAYIGCSDHVTIGERVLMGPGIRIFTEWHVTENLGESIKEQGVGSAPVVIEPDVWIGSGVTILPGVTVGAGSVVAAGSVVNTDVPADSIVAGIPAKVVKDRSAL